MVGGSEGRRESTLQFRKIRFDARRKTVEISNFEYINTLSWLIRVRVCFDESRAKTATT